MLIAERSTHLGHGKDGSPMAGKTNRTETQYDLGGGNTLGLVVALILGVAAVFVGFSVVACCYR